MVTASLRTDPAAPPGRGSRAALRILQAGALMVVLAALPYPLFDLERHAIPKELIAELAGFGAAAYCLVRASRVEITATDVLLAVFLAVSLASALIAPNHWLAFRALGLSFAGTLLFWSARAVARAGFAEQLVCTLAAAVVLGALT